DLHVNSLWQRLRRNLLLFLQLLLVLLAILALLRPGWQGESLVGQRFIFLVDRSASMAARDADGGTRLDAAKKRLLTLIEQLESDMSAMIIAFDDQPDVVQEFTDNRRLLREAVERIQPTAKPTEIRGALELADGFANPERVSLGEGEAEFDATAQEPVELYILSDGRFGAVDDFSLGNLRPKYLPIGSFDANNLAVTALNTRRNENRPEQRQAFVQVANFSDAERTATVELYLDGRLLDAAELKIAAGDAAGTTFNLLEASAGRLEARLAPAPDAGDRLALDNVAYAVLDPPRQARVLLATPGNTPLELALTTQRAERFGKVEKIAPAAIATPDFQRQAQAETYDLVIFDQCAPQRAEQMPPANTLFIGRIPPLAGWLEKSSQQKVSGPQIIDWQRSHPLLNLVEFGNVAIADSLVVRPPAGGKTLVDSTEGPLMAIAPRDGYEDAAIGFEIVGVNPSGQRTANTNWPRHYSFPNFCLNVLQYFGGAAEVQAAHHPPGKPVEVELPARPAEATVVLPDGSVRALAVPPAGKLAVHETDQLGVYEVRTGGERAAQFAVNLFDPNESDVRLRPRQDDKDGLQAVESLEIGFVDVAAQSPSTPVRKELWTTLLLAALFVLVLEWYIYNRRVYV
ncbi:MAG: hypothetical protein DCC67_01150, partial [Planctomycetota bacterium]